MNQMRVGDGTVVLLSGGGKVYTDVAARFTRSERGLSEIIASPYNADLVRSIIEKGHLAATEFDYFLFGVEGYSRVTEVQLVRKRLASYLIKSGRVQKGGKRAYDVVLPDSILPHRADCTLPDGTTVSLGAADLLNMLEEWYNEGVDAGFKEEDLRYLKPQATEFKALIGMNAQKEIRDLAMKMLRLCKEAAPALFEDAGASCVSLGYCPENEFQNPACHIIRKKDALELLRNAAKQS